MGELKPSIWTDKEGRPQMSLDITAEMIKFSPFGKPDSAKQAQGTTAAYQPQGMAYAQPAAPNYQENGFRRRRLYRTYVRVSALYLSTALLYT